MVSREEYVPKIECWHIVAKEWVRCYYDMIPFGHLSRMMVAHLLITVVFHINDFAWIKGASKTLPLFTIIVGMVLCCNLNCVVCNEFFSNLRGSRHH